MASPIRIGRSKLPLGKIPGVVLSWPEQSDMNKTESHYASSVLEPMLKSGAILWYAFEPFKLRLGPKNFYTPDFGVIASGGAMQMHEVKAVWGETRVGFRDDARQKIRDAAQTYQFFQFIVAARRSDKTMRTLRVSERWVYEYLTSHTTRPNPE